MVISLYNSYICNAGGWPGLAFIGSEKGNEPESELVPTASGQHILVSNRWESLYDFDQLCADRGLPVNKNAAVIIDLDKTALGARGRNDHVINQARVQAVGDTVAAYLCLIVGGGLFDANALADDILAERLTSFRAFFDTVNERPDDLPPGLAAIHHDIYNNVLAGDLTPFKAFRRQEFKKTRETATRKGCGIIWHEYQPGSK